MEDTGIQIERHKGRSLEGLGVFRFFLVWNKWKDVLLQDLSLNRKVSWLLLAGVSPQHLPTAHIGSHTYDALIREIIT